MNRVCEDCGQAYDDAACWTICPHRGLHLVAVDGAREALLYLLEVDYEDNTKRRPLIERLELKFPFTRVSPGVNEHAFFFSQGERIAARTIETDISLVLAYLRTIVIDWIPTTSLGMRAMLHPGEHPAVALLRVDKRSLHMTVHRVYKGQSIHQAIVLAAHALADLEGIPS